MEGTKKKRHREGCRKSTKSQSICSGTLMLTRNFIYLALLDAEYLQYSRGSKGVNTFFPCKQ
jgi:hypothetical protein